MTRKQLCLIGTLAACFMLAGCGHEHTWTEAACMEPKTCSECGETEGEALGHTWADATCTVPKTCRVCGETEGEPSEHTLTEANYQQPATCEVCGETVGEPLQAKFEKVGLACNAEQNTEYPVMIPAGEFEGAPITMDVGKVVFSDYEIFDSDDTHEALEGYEWRAITITTLSDSNDAYVFSDLDIYSFPIIIDYYYNFYDVYDESINSYTLNYNGADYTDVKFDGEILLNEWNDDIWTFQVRYLYRVPKGYNGLVATVIDDSKLDDNYNLIGIDQLIGDNAFFRLK